MCSDPVGIANGMVTFTGNSVGDTATYTCNSGFELIGSATATCIQVNGNSAAFSPVPPVCRREYFINAIWSGCMPFNHTRLRVSEKKRIRETLYTIYKKFQKLECCGPDSNTETLILYEDSTDRPDLVLSM